MGVKESSNHRSALAHQSCSRVAGIDLSIHDQFIQLFELDFTTYHGIPRIVEILMLEGTLPQHLTAREVDGLY